MQTVLFVLGGLLLGSAAVVFTAVAWASFGLGGRAAILAAVTAAALAVPVLARRRGLRGTAETFAAVASLLLLLDGYAARAVDLAGLGGVRADTYAGVLCAVVALLAAGYGVAARLVAPRFAALVIWQPALPLLAARLDLGATGWAMVFVAVAAVDLAISGWLRRPDRAGSEPAGARRVLRSVALELAQSAVLVAAVTALVAVVRTDTPGAAALPGGALLAAAGAQLAVAGQRRGALARALAGGALVLAAAVALGWFAVTLPHTLDLVALPAVVTLLAAAVAACGRWLSPPVRRGAHVAALVVAGCGAALAALVTLAVAAVTVEAAAPWFRAELNRPDRPLDWQLPAAVVLLAIALAILLPRPVRPDVGLAGAGLLALAVPATMPLPWWSAPAVALAAATGLAAVAVRTRAPLAATARALLAAGLVGYAVLTGAARPASLAAVLGAVLVLGASVAALGAGRVAAAGPRSARLVGGGALALGLSGAPTAAAAALYAAGPAPGWPSRAALAAAALLLVVPPAVRRAWPGYPGFALFGVCVAAATAPLAALWAPGHEPLDRYAAAAVLLMAAAAAATTRPGAGAVRPPTALALAAGPGVPVLVLLLPALVGTAAAVLVAPYAWLGAVWSGPPAGAGLTPEAWIDPAGIRPLPLVVLAAAAALAAVVWGPAAPGRPRAVARAAVLSAAPPLALAAVAGLPAAGVRWPATAAASLGCGLVALLFAGLRRGAGAAGSVAVVAGMLLAGAGLAGTAATAPATLAGLTVTVLAAVAIGVAGPRAGARVAGWCAAVGFGGLLAYAGAA
ncbi:MAG TPA: hypothetical protein VNV66_04720, partial [Pilimelia sp.]|nr:hypothetical protein [Pilimelia sp.]